MTRSTLFAVLVLAFFLIAVPASAVRHCEGYCELSCEFAGPCTDPPCLGCSTAGLLCTEGVCYSTEACDATFKRIDEIALDLERGLDPPTAEELATEDVGPFRIMKGDEVLFEYRADEMPARPERAAPSAEEKK